MKFEQEIASAINRCNQESGSDTPDFILAQYLTSCLAAFNVSVVERERWYGRTQAPVATDNPASVNLSPPPVIPEPRPTIYLAGPMAGKTDQECRGWRNVAKTLLPSFATHDPMVRDFRGVQMTDAECLQLAHDDKQDIRRSWGVLVKADSGASWGTAMETIFAHERNKVVIAFVGEPGAWVSPWIVAHTAWCASSLEDACAMLESLNPYAVAGLTPPSLRR